MQHCLLQCDSYQLQGIAVQCDVCFRYCLDAASLVKHRTTPGACCMLLDDENEHKLTAGAEAEVVQLVSSSAASANNGRGASEVIVIPPDSVSVGPRLGSTCYEYVPDEAAGDVVTWSGTSTVIESAICKGCRSRFPTASVR